MTPLLVGIAVVALVAMILGATKGAGKKKCPACRQMIPKDLDVCPNCQAQLKPRPGQHLKTGGL